MHKQGSLKALPGDTFDEPWCAWDTPPGVAQTEHARKRRCKPGLTIPAAVTTLAASWVIHVHTCKTVACPAALLKQAGKRDIAWNPLQAFSHIRHAHVYVHARTSTWGGEW